VVDEDKFSRYIESFLASDNPRTDELLADVQVNKNFQPEIGLQVGKFLGLLIRTKPKANILEIGSSLGYSTIWLAAAARQVGGRVNSYEIDSDFYRETRRNLELAGLQEWVELHNADFVAASAAIDNKFDLILQDSDKMIYPQTLECMIELTKLGGIIVADDTLFKPAGVPARLSKYMHEYNKLVFGDQRLYSTILPLGDGITVSLRIK
jgi:predicted O-methyltransferase YrrM